MQNYDLPEDGQGVSTEQPIENQDTVKQVMKLFHKAKQNRDKYSCNWLHYYKMYRGDQWDGIKMPRFRQKEIVNLIFNAVNSGVALQTDARPRITFIPTEPQDIEFAEVLNELVEFDWESNNWLDVLTEVIIDAYLYGIGYSHQGYDPDANLGVGSATYRSEDPFYCYPDFEANQINDENAEIFITAKPVDTKRLKREFPDFADLIKSDVSDAIQSSKTSINDFKIAWQSTDREMPDANYFNQYNQDTEKTLRFDVWMKPYDTKEVAVETGELDEEGNPIARMEVHKVYPNGRKLTIASGVLLEEGPLEFEHANFLLQNI